MKRDYEVMFPPDDYCAQCGKRIANNQIMCDECAERKIP